MKKLSSFVVLVILGYATLHQLGILPNDPPSVRGTQHGLQDAYSNQLSDIQVEGEGTIVKVLPDDLEGSRHQRFILNVGPGHTILISHNIDLAPRIERLSVGDTVRFAGEYEWNPQGGVVHWTHHDPNGRHPGGWLEHHGQTYQ